MKRMSQASQNSGWRKTPPPAEQDIQRDEDHEPRGSASQRLDRMGPHESVMFFMSVKSTVNYP